MRVKHIFLLPRDSPKYGCHLAANSYDLQAYDLHASEYVTSVSIERSKNNEDYAICVRRIRIDCRAPSKWKFVVPPSPSLPLSLPPFDFPLHSYIGWANIYSPFADVTCQITRNTSPLYRWFHEISRIPVIAIFLSNARHLFRYLIIRHRAYENYGTNPRT